MSPDRIDKYVISSELAQQFVAEVWPQDSDYEDYTPLYEDLVEKCIENGVKPEIKYTKL